MPRLANGLFLCFLAGTGATVHAQDTYVVTRFDDPSPNGCIASDCSLREAMAAANGDYGHDIIELGAGTYTLRSTLVASGSVSIVGVGAASTRIVTSVSLDPALQIDESLPILFELYDLSLDARGGFELKGRADSVINLDGVELPNTSGKVWIAEAFGASTTVRDTWSAGSLVISGAIGSVIKDSRFAKLTVLQTDVDHAAAYGTTIERVTVDGTGYTGSGMRIGSIGAVSLADVTVRNTRYGLRFEKATPSVTIDRLHYLANSEPLEFTLDSGVLIRDSEFVANVALDGAGQPGALWVRGDDAIVQVERSTFDTNKGSSPAGGAAFVENGAALVISQSTFSNNSFTAATAASGPRGGAVGYRGSAGRTILRLIGTTLVAPTYAVAGINGSLIGGFGAQAEAQVRLYNSIVDGSCATGIDLDHVEGSISTGSNSCQFPAFTNRAGATKAQLALGSLGNNGGPTKTHLPATGSIAINAGTDYGCYLVAKDQRGYARRSGSACDAGSVETG
ncbi:MAG: hypothetical protein J0L88_03485 [Xanthomonadales bacterium]|nr:hypothetical protein [Xanthomonadales bacterium]